MQIRRNISGSAQPRNNTVKLPAAMEARVGQAMLAGGFSVWAEFCRVALNEKCVSIERLLRVSSPAEYDRIYGPPRSEN